MSTENGKYHLAIESQKIEQPTNAVQAYKKTEISYEVKSVNADEGLSYPRKSCNVDDRQHFRRSEGCENTNELDNDGSSGASTHKFEKCKIMDKSVGTSEISTSSFQCLRFNYLIVTLAVMLADGLQGTHIYVLYEGYGYSVASLYCLGFVTGGLMSPITGPLVDKLGRKKSALLYCILEISINRLEQYPVLAGLIISRMVGGVTTNLLSTVFDSWLDTEYRQRGFDKGKYEIIMRDSVIVSNLAAIGSGYLAHFFAGRYGPGGPFEGAVVFTTIALIVIALVWTENYGCEEHDAKSGGELLSDAINALKSDNKLLKVGVIQGLTCASIQIFIFLWSPSLRHFAQTAPEGTLGLDSNGEPAYGLIFGAFMAAGVLGGLTAPWVRKLTTYFLSSLGLRSSQTEGEGKGRTMAVELLAASCYLLSAILLIAPCVLPVSGTSSFSLCLVAFLAYEYLVGLYLPLEGVIRSLYFPAEGRASIMTLPRIIVNGAVSLGVVATNFITISSAFASISVLLFISWLLQLSLISDPGLWSVGVGYVKMWREKVFHYLTSKVSEPTTNSACKNLAETDLTTCCSRFSTLPDLRASINDSSRSDSFLSTGSLLSSEIEELHQLKNKLD